MYDCLYIFYSTCLFENTVPYFFIYYLLASDDTDVSKDASKGKIKVSYEFVI